MRNRVFRLVEVFVEGTTTSVTANTVEMPGTRVRRSRCEVPDCTLVSSCVLLLHLVLLFTDQVRFYVVHGKMRMKPSSSRSAVFVVPSNC